MKRLKSLQKSPELRPRNQKGENDAENTSEDQNEIQNPEKLIHIRDQRTRLSMSKKIRNQMVERIVGPIQSK